MDPNLTGKFISQLRKENNMTQAQLAQRLGVTDKAVSRWETGKGYPELTVLVSVCEAFNVSVNELLSGERLTDNTLSLKAEENITAAIKRSEEQKKKFSRTFYVLASLLILSALITFFSIFDVNDIVGIITHRFQNSYTIVNVSSNTLNITDSSITVMHHSKPVEISRGGNGYKYDSEYGEYYGRAEISLEGFQTDSVSFDFGFINTNNWHIVNILLTVDTDGENVLIKQYVSYLTDDNEVELIAKSVSVKPDDKTASVRYEGIT